MQRKISKYRVYDAPRFIWSPSGKWHISKTTSHQKWCEKLNVFTSKSLWSCINFLNLSIMCNMQCLLLSKRVNFESHKKRDFRMNFSISVFFRWKLILWKCMQNNKTNEILSLLWAGYMFFVFRSIFEKCLCLLLGNFGFKVYRNGFGKFHIV